MSKKKQEGGPPPMFLVLSQKEKDEFDDGNCFRASLQGALMCAQDCAVDNPGETFYVFAAVAMKRQETTISEFFAPLSAAELTKART